VLRIGCDMARAVIRRLQVTGLWNILNVIEQRPNAGTVKNSWPQAQPHHRCQLLTGPGVNPLHDDGSVEPVRRYRLQS
jgi:hypothetical protein